MIHLNGHCSAGNNVDRQPALARFLVTLAHIVSGLAHCFNAGIKRHEMLAIPLDRKRSSRNGLDRTKRIALDARHLNQPGNRIACHAKVMFQRNFRRIFNLLRRAAQNGRKARSRHGRCRADFALTPHFRTGNGCIVLDDAANSGRCQQKIANALLVRIAMEMEIITQHCGNHTRSSVCGRRHHPATGSVLLVDGHGVNRQPVIGEQRVAAIVTPVFLKLVMQLARAPPHIQPARHDTIAAEPTLNAIAHRAPYPVQAMIQINARHATFFVCALHLCNRKTAGVSHFEHFGCIAERIRHIGPVVDLVATGLHAAQFFRCNDETAANGKIGTAQQKPVVPVISLECHPVGVSGKRRLAIHDQIGFRIEMISGMAFRLHCLFRSHTGDFRIHDVGIDRIGPVSTKAKDDRAVGGMADAGIGKRTVQAGLETVDFRIGRLWPVPTDNFVEEHIGSRHRPHGMRAGRPDANLVKIKNRQKHSHTCCTPSSGCLIIGQATRLKAIAKRGWQGPRA
ncbi:Conserved hypothetical protein [Brucella canis ATCC 23365]|uniref:Uncharacterized protein n=1 Tax=Brucella canis (strain ATCC 23365 / NCTC 10854 / RM-666) TaxID=483179 RepID=A9M5I8_BRUC2|nr:Conserved hypothetical protein [Brucella canis ATCC 23365]